MSEYLNKSSLFGRCSNQCFLKKVCTEMNGVLLCSTQLNRCSEEVEQICLGAQRCIIMLLPIHKRKSLKLRFKSTIIGAVNAPCRGKFAVSFYWLQTYYTRGD